MSYFFILAYIIPLCLSPLYGEVAVTYQLSEGTGLGDHLLGYLHAKWISYRYGVPLLYKPFLYSDEFALHDIEELWTAEKENQFEHIHRGCEESSFSNLISDNLLHIIPFFSDLEEDRQIHPEWPILSIDWKDQGFREMLRPLFARRKMGSVQNQNSKSPCLTAALHIRRGGDEMPYSYAMKVWPMRFAPTQYYVDCLRELSRLFPNSPIYAHIFTDDSNPKEIVEELRTPLKDLPIFFAYKEKNGATRADVIEDFFQLMNFDCLICPLSNFSLIPSLIGDYKVVMKPHRGHWKVVNREVGYVIDEIEIEMD